VSVNAPVDALEVAVQSGDAEQVDGQREEAVALLFGFLD